MLPAVGQGVIGIECAAGQHDTLALIRPLEHAASRTMLEAERAFSARLGGSCQSPIAGHATLDGGTLHLRGLVGSPDGRTIFADDISGPASDAVRLGTSLASRLLDAGAGALLKCLG
jgi:hydroxymethylbilane synthase